MQKLERRFRVVAMETHTDISTDEAQVIAESNFEAITFICRINNLPTLGSNLTITIEQE